jgi:hypothetical protein
LPLFLVEGELTVPSFQDSGRRSARYGMLDMLQQYSTGVILSRRSIVMTNLLPDQIAWPLGEMRLHKSCPFLPQVAASQIAACQQFMSTIL